jgi:hypothetical protein
MANKSLCLLLGLAAAGSMAWLSCTQIQLRQGRGEWQPPRIVQIQGGDVWRNPFPSYGLWVTQPVDGRSIALAQDGDLLMGMYKKDDKGETPIFPYEAGDGTALAVAIEPSRLLMGDRTVYLDLAAGGQGWAWLQKARPGDLAALRFVNIPDDFEPADNGALQRRLLKNLADRRPNVGLGFAKQAVMREVLPWFQPRWLALGDCRLEQQDQEILAGRTGAEVLIINCTNLDSLWFLPRLCSLRKLIMESWEPEKTGPFPVGCGGLDVLVLHEAKMKGLAPLANAVGIRSLGLVDCDIGGDAAGLAKLAGLRSLVLNATQLKDGTGALPQLKGLKWLGLPADASQDVFAGLMKDHPDLVGLEIFGCENIKDLAPLAQLKHPEFLVLVKNEQVKDYAPLKNLKSLRLLVLSSEIFEKSPAEVEALKKALPNTQVVPGGPLCLGSGWILALFPAVAAARLLWARPGKRGRAPRRPDA